MITWDVSPEIFSLGPITIRWYGLLFAASFLIGFQLMTKIFAKEKKSEKELEKGEGSRCSGSNFGSSSDLPGARLPPSDRQQHEPYPEGAAGSGGLRDLHG